VNYGHVYLLLTSPLPVMHLSPTKSRDCINT
jgi:hypothetical protein